MSNIERDPVVRRAIEELQRVPPADAVAIRRVVAAAAAARVAPSVEDEPRGSRRIVGSGYFIAVGAAAAAIMVAFLLPHRTQPAATLASAPTAAASLRAAGPIQPAANGASTDALPIARQFVFNSGTAHSVSVVGDFNGWRADRARMTPAGDGNLWSVTIPVTPGRHMYGFMVDDSVFVLDPRAPSVRDPDLGANASVVIVGKP
jgi:hypothetical protein